MDEPIRDLTWNYPTTGSIAEPEADAVLREINGWDQDGTLLDAYAQVEGRRIDGLWMLDLLRRVRERREPRSQPQARGRRFVGGTGLGLGLAGQPTDPLQPCLGRPGRYTVERAQGARVVG